MRALVRYVSLVALSTRPSIVPFGPEAPPADWATPVVTANAPTSARTSRRARSHSRVCSEEGRMGMWGESDAAGIGARMRRSTSLGRGAPNLDAESQHFFLIATQPFSEISLEVTAQP